MEFIAELKQFEVLQSNQIVLFRNYIQKKYPAASIEQRSIILADTLDKVIDKYIQDFNKEIRDQVKYEVLQRAVLTGNYNINGSDIFRACLFIKDTGENFKALLINWLNKNCSHPVEEKHIDLLLTRVSDSYNQYVESELEYIIGKSIINLKADNYNHPTALKDTSNFIVYFVERVRAAHKYLKGTIVKESISYQILVASLFLIVLLNLVQFFIRQDNSVNGQEAFASQEINHQQSIVQEQLVYELQYCQVDEASLIQYLSKRGSLLCVEPYFSAIMQASREYDINPLLLFAIAGQEQSFVPKTTRNARLIANNPFNVYGSWQVYNTNILDSSRIAANLVATLNKNRPLSVDPIVWINTKYAEDKMWHVGVAKLFAELNNEVLVEREGLELK
ncbi:hypothetical protein Desor_2450 [Desulfosporosinus orientis DSM 765]|uniref:Mannosyl-glycoprotein endo-beta-N-acetylglucosaminidase n=1 Tax=Desulfosporosinus orientis (strain ATCC 19365 / DSM 765 / NCIMB 8382 / VKM B-1628 / Singapore I) TaxID=768706 RepID=G7WFD5_DESOD|nr:hypothetical protein [Desulfosporosinus orientis]AET68021.1 hypothetical protein Desor_2450 [Desulfosporosinus orientis DSM 765]